MNFQPRTAKEIAEQQLLPKGVYDFEILGAEDAKTGPKSKVPGVDIIKLKVGVFTNGGNQRFVNDILHPVMEAKLRHFAEVTGLLTKYEAGTLSAADCVGRTGKCKVVIKEQDGYDPKNEIRDYVKPKVKAESPATPQEPDADSDIPF